jgi:hypothetical protein
MYPYSVAVVPTVELRKTEPFGTFGKRFGAEKKEKFRGEDRKKTKTSFSERGMNLPMTSLLLGPV